MIAFMTLLVLIILIVVIYELYTNLTTSSTTPPTAASQQQVTITSALADARSPVTYSTPLPPSSNEPDGIEYTFAFWMNIADFEYNKGNSKYALIKGDAAAKTASPAIFLDATRNVLHVRQDTFDGEAHIEIPSITTNVLLHVATVITQTTLSVYIDGILREYRTIDIPKQNVGSVFIAPGGGFSGQIGPVVYYNYALDAQTIANLAQQYPGNTPPAPPAAPPYYDPSWYTGAN
jgi:hypothetical protein